MLALDEAIGHDEVCVLTLADAIGHDAVCVLMVAEAIGHGGCCILMVVEAQWHRWMPARCCDASQPYPVLSSYPSSMNVFFIYKWP